MATAKIVLDNRYHRADGMFPVVIRTSVFGKKIIFPTGIACNPSDFSESGGKNRYTWLTGNNSIYNNAFLRHRLSAIVDAVSILAVEARSRNLSTTDIREKLTYIVDGKKIKEPMLLETMAEFADIKQGRTKIFYLSTIAKLKKYMKEDIALSDIDKAWLERFQAHELTYTAQNSASIHLKNIRTVFNYAIDNEMTNNYPFRRFKIKYLETAKRSLTIAQLNSLLTVKLMYHRRKYLDVFMLSFYLIGINPIDMLTLKSSNLRNGRIEYVRHKTHKPYSVKVEPEAMEIINRYQGKDYLINPLDNCGYCNWLQHCNRSLKKISYDIEPGLTMYWARHTWATIAASLDIPKETISAALGHEIGSKVTSIYINFDQRKVDAANRRVMDYILGK